MPRPPGLPGGFDHGGPWAEAVPSAALAAALEAAAGPEGLYQGAETDALVGIAQQWAAVESWAASGKLAALRAMSREDADGTPRLRRRPDLPDGWDDSLTYEISAALAMGPVSAGNLAHLAWTLGTRLAGTGRLLAEGTLTLPKARLIAATFEPLDEQEAARAEALILDELPGKTYPQVERLAWRAALAVAPDIAERRRAAGEKQARVTVFREESGAVGLSGRDLPADQALAGHANVVARAREYTASGAFPEQTSSRLEAIAYLDLLNGVSAQERIAFATSKAEEPPAGSSADGDGHAVGPEDSDDQDKPGEDDGGAPGPPGSPGPDDGHGDGGTGPGDSSDRPGPSGEGGSGGGRRRDSNSDNTGYGDSEPGPQGPGDESHGDSPNGPDEADGSDGPDRTGGADGADGADRSGGADGTDACEVPGPPLAEVTVPLATLQHRAERAGDNRLLGPLDPALARDLANAAARSPWSCWEITVVDEHGYATGHGTARPIRPIRPIRSAPHQPQPPPQPPPGPAASALPARVTITTTEQFLRQLQTQAAQPRPGGPPHPAGPPPPGAPPGGWALTPGKPGIWVLTLPGGRQLTARLDAVPTYDCDHRYAVSSYLPGDRLRRLIQVRDHTCTWPPCSRPARESDFEHAVPYDKGGMTDACNAGARSRRCHQVKQLPGWTLTQPKPGWHVWTTPTGRTYVQEPWRYTA